MSDEDAAPIAAEAAEDFKRQVQQARTVRVRADDLMAAFGLATLEQDARESVADALWEAGVCAEPSLAGAGIDAGTKIKLAPVNATQVNAAMAWRQTPAGKRSARPEARYAISPVAAGTAAVGGVLLALASFLPLDQPSGAFARVQSNTLIQHGYWWVLIGAAVIVLAALRAYTTGKRSETTSVLVLGVIAAVLVIYAAQDTSLRTLYPIGASGEPEASATGTVVPLGIAIYVAGAGVLLALIGGWMMRQTAAVVQAVEPELTTRCPECAETILAAARVCKHCGHRLEPAVSDPAS
ncbi:MAG: zinc ribbon domain-containing protein [Solirubrobacteraceae bacterium]